MGAERALRDPQGLAIATIRQHLIPYTQDDPRRPKMPSEEIEEIKATSLDGC